MHTALLASWLVVQTQPAATDRTTMSGSARFIYETVKGYIVKSADKMPAGEFAFRPTPDVRPFGQILAHIATATTCCAHPP